MDQQAKTDTSERGENTLNVDWGCLKVIDRFRNRSRHVPPEPDGSEKGYGIQKESSSLASVLCDAQPPEAV